MNDEWLQENIEEIRLFLKVGMIIFFLYIVVVPIIKWRIEEKKKNKRKIEERKKGNKFYDFQKEKIEFFVDKSRVKPKTFGRKIDWIAVKSNNHEEVVKEFRKPEKKSYKTNLENGVYGAYASNIFIYPPINNWVLVIHPEITLNKDEQFEYLKNLSNKYDEVQFYGNFRGVGYSAWMKFKNGKTERAFSVADGKIYRNEGSLTELEEKIIEREIQLATDDEELNWKKGEGRLLCLSDEEYVLEIAENWSINPDKLDKLNLEELGTIIEI